MSGLGKYMHPQKYTWLKIIYYAFTYTTVPPPVLCTSGQKAPCNANNSSLLIPLFSLHINLILIVSCRWKHCHPTPLVKGQVDPYQARKHRHWMYVCMYGGKSWGFSFNFIQHSHGSGFYLEKKRLCCHLCYWKVTQYSFIRIVVKSKLHLHCQV